VRLDAGRPGRKTAIDFGESRTIAAQPTFISGSGVTVFLTTHRLEEAERLCDRVAIMNTTLRTIGRRHDLRAQLFNATLLVTTRQPLADPERDI
jgi:ABC-type uncharacterized transport system ATPase subunit